MAETKKFNLDHDKIWFESKESEQSLELQIDTKLSEVEGHIDEATHQDLERSVKEYVETTLQLQDTDKNLKIDGTLQDVWSEMHRLQQDVMEHTNEVIGSFLPPTDIVDAAISTVWSLEEEMKSLESWNMLTNLEQGIEALHDFEQINNDVNKDPNILQTEFTRYQTQAKDINAVQQHAVNGFNQFTKTAQAFDAAREKDNLWSDAWSYFSKSWDSAYASHMTTLTQKKEEIWSLFTKLDQKLEQQFTQLDKAWATLNQAPESLGALYGNEQASQQEQVGNRVNEGTAAKSTLETTKTQLQEKKKHMESQQTQLQEQQTMMDQMKDWFKVWSTQIEQASSALTTSSSYLEEGLQDYLKDLGKEDISVADILNGTISLESVFETEQVPFINIIKEAYNQIGERSTFLTWLGTTIATASEDITLNKEQLDTYAASLSVGITSMSKGIEDVTSQLWSVEAQLTSLNNVSATIDAQGFTAMSSLDQMDHALADNIFASEAMLLHSKIQTSAMKSQVAGLSFEEKWWTEYLWDSSVWWVAGLIWNLWSYVDDRLDYGIQSIDAWSDNTFGSINIGSREFGVWSLPNTFLWMLKAGTWLVEWVSTMIKNPKEVLRDWLCVWVLAPIGKSLTGDKEAKAQVSGIWNWIKNEFSNWRRQWEQDGGIVIWNFLWEIAILAATFGAGAAVEWGGMTSRLWKITRLGTWPARRVLSFSFLPLTLPKSIASRLSFLGKLGTGKFGSKLWSLVNKFWITKVPFNTLKKIGSKLRNMKVPYLNASRLYKIGGVSGLTVAALYKDVYGHEPQDVQHLEEFVKKLETIGEGVMPETPREPSQTTVEEESTQTTEDLPVEPPVDTVISEAVEDAPLPEETTETVDVSTTTPDGQSETYEEQDLQEMYLQKQSERGTNKIEKRRASGDQKKLEKDELKLTKQEIKTIKKEIKDDVSRKERRKLRKDGRRARKQAKRNAKQGLDK